MLEDSFINTTVLLTPRRWLVMLAASAVLSKCSRTLNTHVDTGKLSFLSRHVQYAGLSFRATNAPPVSGTTTAGWRNDGQPKHCDSNLSTNNVKAWKNKDQPPPSLIENTLESHLAAGQSGAYRLEPTDEPGQSSTITSTISEVYVIYKEGGKQQIRQLNSPTDLDQWPLKSWFKSWRPFSGIQNTKHGPLDGEETPDIYTPQIEHLPAMEENGPEKGGNWNLAGTQQELNVDKPAAGAKQPTTDPLSGQLQSVQTENNSIEAVHQRAVREGRTWPSTKPAEDDALHSAKWLPTKDALFERLRNPSRNRTRSGLESSKQSSTKDGKPEEAAGESPRKAFHRVIRAASVEDIEQKLHHTAHYKPSVDSVQFMLKELIEVRHIRPQARHYEALILANCEARHGSADALYPILAEMEREKIGIGCSTLSAVLKVLSIHPDAQLVPPILQTFSALWSAPSVIDTTHLVLSLTRLNQFELAIEHLEHLISTSPPPNNHLQSHIPQYLYTTILYRFASSTIADQTAALHLLYLLTDNNLPISNVCVSYMLDSAAEALHLDLTLYLWHSHVDTNYIIPSTGLCRNVLLTASRNANAKLASKAGRVLDSRGNRTRRAGGRGLGLEAEELEMVRDAYLGDGEVHTMVGFQTVRRTVDRIGKRMVELRKEGGRRDRARSEEREERAREKMEKLGTRVRRWRYFQYDSKLPEEEQAFWSSKSKEHREKYLWRCRRRQERAEQASNMNQG